jgi:hypothetical protein
MEFNDEPLVKPDWAEGRRESRFPPDGCWEHEIVRIGEHLAFKHPDDIQPDGIIVWFDGDYRNVLLPDDPRLK